MMEFGDGIQALDPNSSPEAAPGRISIDTYIAPRQEIQLTSDVLDRTIKEASIPNENRFREDTLESFHRHVVDRERAMDEDYAREVQVAEDNNQPIPAPVEDPHRQLINAMRQLSEVDNFQSAFVLNDMMNSYEDASIDQIANWARQITVIMQDNEVQRNRLVFAEAVQAKQSLIGEIQTRLLMTHAADYDAATRNQTLISILGKYNDEASVEAISVSGCVKYSRGYIQTGAEGERIGDDWQRLTTDLNNLIEEDEYDETDDDQKALVKRIQGIEAEVENSGGDLNTSHLKDKLNGIAELELPDSLDNLKQRLLQLRNTLAKHDKSKNDLADQADQEQKINAKVEEDSRRGSKDRSEKQKRQSRELTTYNWQYYATPEISRGLQQEGLMGLYYAESLILDNVAILTPNRYKTPMEESSLRQQIQVAFDYIREMGYIHVMENDPSVEKEKAQSIANSWVQELQSEYSGLLQGHQITMQMLLSGSVEDGVNAAQNIKQSLHRRLTGHAYLKSSVYQDSVKADIVTYANQMYAEKTKAVSAKRLRRYKQAKMRQEKGEATREDMIILRKKYYTGAEDWFGGAEERKSMEIKSKELGVWTKVQAYRRRMIVEDYKRALGEENEDSLLVRVISRLADHDVEGDNFTLDKAVEMLAGIEGVDVTYDEALERLAKHQEHFRDVFAEYIKDHQKGDNLTDNDILTGLQEMYKLSKKRAVTKAIEDGEIALAEQFDEEAFIQSKQKKGLSRDEVEFFMSDEDFETMRELRAKYDESRDITEQIVTTDAEAWEAQSVDKEVEAALRIKIQQDVEEKIAELVRLGKLRDGSDEISQYRASEIKRRNAYARIGTIKAGQFLLSSHYLQKAKSIFGERSEDAPHRLGEGPIVNRVDYEENLWGNYFDFGNDLLRDAHWLAVINYLDNEVATELKIHNDDNWRTLVQEAKAHEDDKEVHHIDGKTERQKIPNAQAGAKLLINHLKEVYGVPYGLMVRPRFLRIGGDFDASYWRAESLNLRPKRRELEAKGKLGPITDANRFEVSIGFQMMTADSMLDDEVEAGLNNYGNVDELLRRIIARQDRVANTTSSRYEQENMSCMWDTDLISKARELRGTIGLIEMSDDPGELHKQVRSEYHDSALHGEIILEYKKYLLEQMASRMPIAVANYFSEEANRLFSDMLLRNSQSVRAITGGETDLSALSVEQQDQVYKIHERVYGKLEHALIATQNHIVRNEVVNGAVDGVFSNEQQGVFDQTLRMYLSDGTNDYDEYAQICHEMTDTLRGFFRNMQEGTLGRAVAVQAEEAEAGNGRLSEADMQAIGQFQFDKFARMPLDYTPTLGDVDFQTLKAPNMDWTIRRRGEIIDSYNAYGKLTEVYTMAGKAAPKEILAKLDEFFKVYAGYESPEAAEIPTKNLIKAFLEEFAMPGTLDSGQGNIVRKAIMNSPSTDNIVRSLIGADSSLMGVISPEKQREFAEKHASRIMKITRDPSSERYSKLEMRSLMDVARESMNMFDMRPESFDNIVRSMDLRRINMRGEQGAKIFKYTMAISVAIALVVAAAAYADGINEV